MQKSVTFDQFNASLLNKINNSDPNIFRWSIQYNFFYLSLEVSFLYKIKLILYFCP